MFKSKPIALLCSYLALAACGGGGGNSTQTSPPPILSNNIAPITAISVSNMSPNEGLTSTLDASGSSDADGDSLTFSWTQLSGPDLSFSAPSDSVTDVSVPNLAQDETARIQLQVSDGNDVTIQEVTLNLINVVLTPIATAPTSGEINFDYPNRILAIASGSVISTVVSFTITNFIYQDDTILKVDRFRIENSTPVITPDELEFETDPLQDANQRIETLTLGGRNSDPLFSIAETSKVTIVEGTRPLLSVDIENPCTVTPPRRKNSGLDTAVFFSIIGIRDGGARVFEFTQDGFSFNPISGTEILLDSEFGGDASLCEMVYTGRLITDFDTNFPDELLAFDQKTDRIIHYQLERDSLNGTITDLIEVASAPVELNLPEGINAEFVTSQRISNRGAIALVYSDGQTEGNHRLVIVGLGENKVIRQEILSWEYGVPKSINTRRDLNSENQPVDSYIISTQASPFAVIFQSEPIFGTRSYFPFSGPAYDDLGVGHDLVSPFTALDDISGTIVTYPEENRIRLITR